MNKILALHGPNLNVLGIREPYLYGQQTLVDINQLPHKEASERDFDLQALQSNSESELIQAIHQANTDNVDSLMINLAGFTHTSIALRDVLVTVQSRLLKTIFVIYMYMRVNLFVSIRLVQKCWC